MKKISIFIFLMIFISLSNSILFHDSLLFRRIKIIEPKVVVPTTEEELVSIMLTEHGFDAKDFRLVHDGYAQDSRPLSYIAEGRVQPYDKSYVRNLQDLSQYKEEGEEIIKNGRLAVVILKGGAALRLVGGGVDKALVPMIIMPDGTRKSLLEIQLTKIKELKDKYGGRIPVILSNSYLNDQATREYLEREEHFGLAGDVQCMIDVGIGKRLIPRPEDLEEEFRRKEEGMREYERQVAEAALESEKKMVQGWVEDARRKGAEFPYEYQPMGIDQRTKLHPLGHFQVLPTLFFSGELRRLIEEGVEYLMLYNVDNLFNLEDMGIDVRPEILGYMAKEGKGVATEFTDRGSDIGGVLAKVQELDENGKPKVDENGNPVYRHRILEGIVSDPLVESDKNLDLINTATHYISIDALLKAFGFVGDTPEKRKEAFLNASAKETEEKVKQTLAKVERYTVIKRVSELFPDGREYKNPVIQFERLLGDFPLLLEETDWQPIYVPRIGKDSRFLPVKDLDTLTEIRMREASIGSSGESPLINNAQEIINIIKSQPTPTDMSDIQLFSSLNYQQLLKVVEELRDFVKQPTTTHLQKLRAFEYLFVIFLDYLPDAALKKGIDLRGGVPSRNVLERWGKATGTLDFMEIADLLYQAYCEKPSLTISWWLSKAYERLRREARQDQVEESMGAYLSTFLGVTPHTLAEYQARIGGENQGLREELIKRGSVKVRIGCRVELDSIVGSDIFGISMDYPEGSRVMNAAIWLRLADPLKKETAIEPPITVVVRKIDKPVVRLTSIDLGQSYEYDTWSKIRDITMDDLGLLKAALLATGIIPLEPLWKIEEAVKYFSGINAPLSQSEIEELLKKSSEEIRRELSKIGLQEVQIDKLFENYTVGLKEILEKFTGEKNCGIEVITYVKDIARGSGLAISTSLAAGLGAALLQFRGLADYSTTDLDKSYQYKEWAVATALRMEWLEISGGGYQDPAALWGGVHDIRAIPETNPNATTRGKLVPKYETIELKSETKELLQRSIVIAFLGMAQAVGPILDIITDSYYLRRAWDARKDSEKKYDRQLKLLKELDNIAPQAMRGDEEAYKRAMDILKEFGRNMAEDYENRRAISPEAANKYGDMVIGRLKGKLWGYNTTGARAGAGHIFVVNPALKATPEEYEDQLFRKDTFEAELLRICEEVKKELAGAYRITYPVRIYDWEIAPQGVIVDILDKEKTSNEIDELLKAMEIIIKMKTLR